MTAIYGLWRFDGADVASDFARMDAALLRYGGDGHETSAPASGLSMGRHLHASLPEDCLGHSAERKGRYLVVADVRLTERDDLARELGLGADALRMSDAAIAAAAIERWHEEAFDRIYGAFAVAAWDTEQRRLLLARDHIGQKPLFFHAGEELFAFASMPIGLHAVPAVPRGPDIEGIKRFLAVENLSPGKTHYEGIGRVMPGHYAIVGPEGVAQVRYWQPDLTPLSLSSHQAYVDAFAEHLERAVAAALRGGGAHVAAHLSSGFDSTAVATTAARQLAKAGATLVAYTSAPREGCDKTLPGRLADESALASATAAMHPNIEHVVVRSNRTPLENLGRTASIYGAPVLNICNMTWFDPINDDAAGRGITVLLESSMGNATISETGMLALPELLRSGRVIPWLRLSLALVRKRVAGAPAVAWNSFNSWLPDPVYRWVVEKRYGSLVSTSASALKEQYQLEAMEGAASESPVPAGVETRPSSGWTRPSGRSVDDRLMMVSSDDNGALWKGILGEWKIDCRDPTADRRLVEFSLRIPTEQLIHGGEQRAILRKFLADRVPREVLDNRLKGYQAADWHEWLTLAREGIADEIARMDSFEPAAEILDLERLKGLLERWPAPGADEWNDYEAVAEYRCCLLRAISAVNFMRQAAGSNQ